MEETKSAIESVDSEDSLNTGNDITYELDKMTFIVTPVYRDGSGKTIHDILLNLMERDCEPT